MDTHPARHAGVRWRILCGSYAGVERFAVDELQRGAQAFLPYVARVQRAEESGPLKGHEDNLILAGTPRGNRAVADLVDRGIISLPVIPESYTLACVKSPWNEARKALVVAGRDERGVLYGVVDLCSRSFGAYSPRKGTPRLLSDAGSNRRESFDAMPEFALSEAPKIESRGIWTWGYVVYDYRRFLDRMARLRMNLLIVWNDCPPINAPQIIDYAHSRGVRVVFGFHWGWGRADVDIANPEHALAMRREVVENYRRNYRSLDLDGIYFQTLTEHTDTNLGNRTVAAAATDWVNTIAEGLYEIDPKLYIQFGLHATSIGANFPELMNLDPRITIVWEDAGVLPYAYNPDELAYGPEKKLGEPWDGVRQTTDYSRKLATFRRGSEFAMVPKGWTWLGWKEEFEHHGPFVMGERHPEWIRRRLEERRPRWDFVNAAWLKNYRVAAGFYREILECRPAKMLVAGLVEDGMFEEATQPAVSLFAQTIWDPTRADDEILSLALDRCNEWA